MICARQEMGHAATGRSLRQPWAWRGSHSFPGDTLGRERQVEILFQIEWVCLFLKILMFFFPPHGSCVAEEGSCPSFTGKAKPSSQHRRAKLLSSDPPGLWRGLAAHRGHGLSSGSVNPGLGLHLANQVWMRPNDEVTALCDPKTQSPILRNSCRPQFREVKDISSGEMDVPKGPKSHLRAKDQPC